MKNIQIQVKFNFFSLLVLAAVACSIPVEGYSQQLTKDPIVQSAIGPNESSPTKVIDLSRHERAQKRTIESSVTSQHKSDSSEGMQIAHAGHSKSAKPMPKALTTRSVGQEPAANALSGSTLRVAAPLRLKVGQVHILEFPNLMRIAIGNGKVMTATVVDDKQILIIAEANGGSSLHIWQKGGQQTRIEVTIAEDDQSKLVSQLQFLLKEFRGISVSPVGERIVIEGQYPDQNAAAKMEKIIEAYPQILNLVQTTPAEIVFEKPQMVTLDVKVLEIRKRALDNLGISWATSASGPTFTTSGYLYSNTAPRATGGFPTPTPARPFLSYLGWASSITSMINFLETNQDLWLLAEPKISAVNGGKASFKVGGEIPIPVAQGNGAVAIVYKEYGVIIEFSPLVDSQGNIRASIKAEVSDIDSANSSLNNGAAFVKNETKTEVSMRENQTLVISGLIRNKGVRGTSSVPGLGKVPVLGRLFSNRDFTNEQTELVVVVTPKLQIVNSNESNAEAKEANDRIFSLKEVIKEGLIK
jgi:pilus assembly protein CpaC